MRKIRVMLTLILAAILTLSAVSALAEDTAMFSADDLNVGALYYGASPEDVHAALGSPESSETNEVAATGDTEVLWHYNNLTLTFLGESLVAANWTDPALIGPRGLRVGDGEETVLSAFYRDTAQTDADVLYTSGWVEDQGMQLPPSGVIYHNEDHTFYVHYLAPMEPYSEDVLKDLANFVYESHAILTFGFDLEGKLSSIQWRVSSLAE